MSDDSWFARRLRSTVGQPPSAAARQIAARATRTSVVRRRRPDLPAKPPVARKLVVCGDDPLALRLITELTSRYSAEVTAVMPSRRRNHGPQIDKIPGVRIVESDTLDVATFRQARLQSADAVAVVRQDDVGNIHAALQAQEVNPRIRLVIRMFNMSLGYGVRRLFPDCAVLSDAGMAAPAFVSAALGEVAPVHVRLQGRTLYLARRADVRPADVICGLAGAAVDGAGADLLPADPGRAELVLAAANGSPARLLGAVLDWDATPDDAVSIDEAGTTAASAVPADGWLEGRQPAPRRWWRRTDRLRAAARWRNPVAPFLDLINGKLRTALLVLLVALVAGTVAVARAWHMSWWNGAYLTLLTTLGGAEPDLGNTPAKKIIQAVLTVVSIALIPVITAAVVDAVVNARLLSMGRLRRPMADHVVVVGLGNVGTRVIRQLHALGVAVVAVDRNEGAKGAQVAHRLGIPLIIGDASREGTLRAASVQTCRALVCLSTDDVTNLEAALYGKAIKEDLRVVLRLFDGDFADRAQRAFGITISRSVSYLAAPEFAAAMVERQVVGTIPVGRRVLLIAEMPVCAGSSLIGATVATANEAGQARVIALTTERGRHTTWCPAEHQALAETDVLTVVATRTGLARTQAMAGDPLARPGQPQPGNGAEHDHA